jgi:cell division protein FtsB
MKLDVQRAETEKQVWERRVAAMRAQNLDRDALDERVRDRLNLSAPSDIIVMYPPGQRLF